MRALLWIGIWTGVCSGALSLQAVAEETTCPAGVLDKKALADLQERRERTFEHCLACTGNRCTLKAWPAQKEAQTLATMCKEFFCTPKRIPRTTFSPPARDMSGTVYYTYEIGTNGRATNFVVTTYSGSINEDEALAWVQAMYKRRRYEPIKVDGQTYVLTGLKNVARIRSETDIRFNR